jgi:putative addiction module component (TIGR02574 family)
MPTFKTRRTFDMTITEIMQEVLHLPASERFEIVDRILQSLDKPDPEIERIWGEEAVRRLAAFDAGHGKTYAMEEVFGDS